MKKIYIIRHAESASNAGEKTDDHHSIPLTAKGRTQAQELAETLAIKPDLIVISPYSRTRETAMPFIAKHADVPVETWDVHEFTYLEPALYNGTTKYERDTPARIYWEESHITYKAHPESESFYEFTKRIEQFLQNLQARKEETIIIFSHGRFIYALQLYLARRKALGLSSLPDDEIAFLKQLHAEGVREKIPFPIHNVSVHEIEL